MQKSATPPANLTSLEDEEEDDDQDDSADADIHKISDDVLIEKEKCGTSCICLQMAPTKTFIAADENTG